MNGSRAIGQELIARFVNTRIGGHVPAIANFLKIYISEPPLRPGVVGKSDSLFVPSGIFTK
jgi:hypothetical protein